MRRRVLIRLRDPVLPYIAAADVAAGPSEEKRAALSASLAANAAPVVVVRESARREETFQALKVRVWDGEGGGEGVVRFPRASPVSIFFFLKYFFCHFLQLAGLPFKAESKKVLLRVRNRLTSPYVQERGAPSEPTQYPDADEAASVLLAAGGPVDMEYHALKL